MLEPKPLFMLMDGHALVRRAYHGLPPLSAQRTGEPTGAVLGFTKALLKALRDNNPTHCAIVFDRPSPTFRHLKFEQYKANRKATPDDFRVQLRRVRELVAAFGIPVYEMDGYEADDLLGTFAKQASEQGVDTVILTGDFDITQLVSPKVKVIIPTKSPTGSHSITYDENKVLERFGVKPAEIPDWKGLAGDSSDNIPGVPGIGPKTATGLIKQFGSVENIYKRLGEVTPPRIQVLLRDNRDQATLSVELARIVLDVPLDLDLSDCARPAFNLESVLPLFQELEFSNLLSQLPKGVDGSNPKPSADNRKPTICKTIIDESSLETMINVLRGDGYFAFDTETTSLDSMSAELVGISFSSEPGSSYYVPVGHNAGEQMPRAQVLEMLGPLFNDSSVKKTAHNANYDLMILARYGVVVTNLDNDSMIAAFLAGDKGIGLKALSFNRLGIEMTPITDLIGKGSKKITMDKVPIESASPYAGADSDITLQLSGKLKEELIAKGLWDIMTDVELPLVPIIVDMQRTGIALDGKMLEGMSLELGERLGELEANIYESVGHRFKINSPQQLGDVLFKEIGLPSSKRTKTGFSTDARVLEGLKGAHPIINQVLEYRHIAKLKSTYLDALPLMINPETQRIHTTFNQTGTVTGRISSNEPNLQNIPIRTELGGQIRHAFIAHKTPDYALLAADYSQIDLRVLAHISGDPALLKAFQQDEDIHASTASHVYKVSIG